MEPVLKDTSDNTGATLESPSSAAHYVAPSAAVTQVCVIMSFTAVNPYHDLLSQESSLQVVAQLGRAAGAEAQTKCGLDSAAEMSPACRNTEITEINTTRVELQNLLVG